MESAPEPVPELQTEPMSQAPAPAASKPVEPASLEPRPEVEVSPPPTTVAEPTFPKAQPNVLDPVAKPVDTGMYRPRIIPEAMNAKLGEPPPVQPTNGKRGPIRIGSSAADTQIFRRVLEKMSGETVIGVGEPEPELAAAADKPRSQNRELPTAEVERPELTLDPVAALRELAVAAASDFAAEVALEPVVPPKQARAAQPKAPEPKPASAKRATKSWPPKLPSNDPDWEDSLETNE
jgi:hypothetical protein